MITISKATDQELSIIHDIAHRTWPSTFAEILSPVQIKYMLAMMYSSDALSQQMNGQNHVFLLAHETESNAYLGYVSYEFNYRGQSKTKIHKLYLLPESQGKGVGRLLVDKVAELATNHKNEKLSLNVNKHNKAIQFYERIGFTVVDNETIDIGSGFLMEDLVMEKPLS